MKRYNIFSACECGRVNDIEDTTEEALDGNWVKYEDVLKENAEQAKRIGELEKYIECSKSVLESYNNDGKMHALHDLCSIIPERILNKLATEREKNKLPDCEECTNDTSGCCMVCKWETHLFDNYKEKTT